MADATTWHTIFPAFLVTAGNGRPVSQDYGAIAAISALARHGAFAEAVARLITDKHVRISILNYLLGISCNVALL